MRWPLAKLWLAGFSFGGAVALRAALQSRPQRLVAVAPAVSRVDLSGVNALSAPWLVVMGDADELVSPEEVQQWAARQSHPPQFALLPGVGHLFHGKLQELRNAVLAYLQDAA
jgi:alpha/beta superfamily hydrolase